MFEESAELCITQENYSVEIEHLLVKLVSSPPGADAQHIFSHYKIEPARLHRELHQAIEHFKRGGARTPVLSPYLISLLKEAWLISSLRFNCESIRSGALLLAIIDQDALRGALLESSPTLMQIPREGLRTDIEEIIKDSIEAHRKIERMRSGDFVEPFAAEPKRAKPGKQASVLEQFTVDLTWEAKQGGIDQIAGRDSEIRQLIDILTRRRQNNPILVGEAGVGKTAVVEGFALRIIRGDMPAPLRHVTVRTLDLGLLQAGAGVRGEFEERLKSVIQAIKDAPTPIVLFIDEAHTLIGAGGTAGLDDAANLLKPALARGELRVIAATTWAEYKKYFEKDPALARRFQAINIQEPDEKTAVMMLRGIAHNLAAHHDVSILDVAVREAVSLSHRYISGRQLPDKAVTVLDTACARIAVARRGEPSALEDVRRHLEYMEKELTLLLHEQAAGIDHQEAVKIITAKRNALLQAQEALERRWREESDIVQRVTELEREIALSPHAIQETSQTTLNKLKAVLSDLQQKTPMVPLCVDGNVVAQVIAGWTGIPLGKMRGDEISRILTIQKEMAKRLIGQDHALEAIAKRIHAYRANIDEPGKPIGVFLLSGPSGTGKTETASVLAELLYGGESHLITINMSEYQSDHSISSLKGAPPGYIGYGKGGVLTEAIRRAPYSVLLLDEAEKAHPNVLELFYQVFDKGVLEDSDGMVVDFKNTLILLTCNLGAEVMLAQCQGESRPSVDALQPLIREALLQHFPPALLGRMTVIPYYPLRTLEIQTIVRLKLDKIAKRFQRNHRIALVYEDAVIQTLTERCQILGNGARAVDQLFTQILLPALAARILERMAQGLPLSTAHLYQDECNEFQLDFVDNIQPSITSFLPEFNRENLSWENLNALLDWVKSE